MSRDIEAAVLTEAQLEENKPVYLVEIELDTTLYYTDNNEDVNFPTAGGNTYTANGITFSPISFCSKYSYMSFSFINKIVLHIFV